MLQNILRSLCSKSGGVVLVAGAIGVLAGVEYFMSGRGAGPSRVRTPAKRERPGMPKSLDRFSIRRTQSELGYTYWVLQGFGQYSGFTLLDTWQEAVDEMQRRTRQGVSDQDVTWSAPVFVR